VYNGLIPTKEGNKMLTINQIVKGKVAGYFVVLGFRTVGGEKYAQLKCVNPANFSQTSGGELALPVSALEEVA
tara:strand:+ start:311 stop:529 length:219 start_codon:yes stop_codon:yes gene_type:complete